MYKISIEKQIVVEEIDLSLLVKAEWQRGSLKDDEVMNGIAISGGRMLITGKDWRTFFATKM